MVVARRRRRRRPILPLLALVVTAAVIVTVVGRHSATNPDARLAWLDQVRPVVQQSNQLGLELADLRDQVRGLDRPTLSRRLDRLAVATRDLERQASGIGAPSSVATARSL